jgi:purine nucleoside permease
LTSNSHVFHLDSGLVNWAYALTKDTPLVDDDRMKARRASYVGYPKALLPPSVLKGDNLSSSTYWHGRLLNEWASAWVTYYTAGKGRYVTTAMEDSGTLRSLVNLNRAGRVDVRRVLLLRTASDYSMQWPGGTAAGSLNGEKVGTYSAYIPSLEAAYRVGSRVVHALINDWRQYGEQLPSAPVP